MIIMMIIIIMIYFKCSRTDWPSKRRDYELQ